MCIRDSFDFDDCPPWTDHAASSAAGRRIAPAASSTSDRNPCLLYTSDAADERSSVDLGGRRIIKKKKTKNPMGGVH